MILISRRLRRLGRHPGFHVGDKGLRDLDQVGDIPVALRASGNETSHDVPPLHSFEVLFVLSLEVVQLCLFALDVKLSVTKAKQVAFGLGDLRAVRLDALVEPPLTGHEVLLRGSETHHGDALQLCLELVKLLLRLVQFNLVIELLRQILLEHGNACRESCGGADLRLHVDECSIELAVLLLHGRRFLGEKRLVASQSIGDGLGALEKGIALSLLALHVSD